MSASANKPPALGKRALSQTQRQQHNFSFGEWGEQKASEFLQARGYVVLEQNVSLGKKEIDLIALDQELNELVLVEVKARQRGVYGDPSRAVDRRKICAMHQVGRAYCRKNKISLDYRFDIITLVSGRIRHYQNVTW